MATATKKGPRNAARIVRMSDLIDRLGGIDPQRIYWNPMPGTATEADVIAVVERKLGRCELIDGTVVEKPPIGVEEDFLAMELGAFVIAFIRPRRLGRVYGSQGLARMHGGNVRMPDAGFLDGAQYRRWQKGRPKVVDGAPAIAIEVVSESNTRAELAQKRREYFKSGSRLVWELDFPRRTLTVYTSPTKHTVLGESDTLDGGTVLPGFTLPLAELFKGTMDED